MQFKQTTLTLIFLCGFSFQLAHADTDVPWVGTSFSGIPCTGVKITVAKKDYTDPIARRDFLPVVEENHFTEEIEKLIKGKTAPIGAELHYTISAFPNHHRALNSLMHFRLLQDYDIKTGKKPEFETPVECYFQRAINFSPQDAVTQILYATYLKKVKRYNDADYFFQKAIETDPEQLKYRYNYGLFLMTLKQYDKAREQAKIIYDQNYPEQKLKQQLIKAGLWDQESQQ